MKVRKALELPQLTLVNCITEKIGDLNPGMQIEYDFTMLHPVISAVNQLIKDIHAQGDMLFTCDCNDIHEADCHLAGTVTCDVTVKYHLHWRMLLELLDRQDIDVPMSWSEIRERIPAVDGVFKAIITEALDRKLLVRDAEGWFYIQ